MTAEAEMTLAQRILSLAFPRGSRVAGIPRVQADNSAMSALRGRIHIDSQPWKASRMGRDGEGGWVGDDDSAKTALAFARKSI